MWRHFSTFLFCSMQTNPSEQFCQTMSKSWRENVLISNGKNLNKAILKLLTESPTPFLDCNLSLIASGCILIWIQRSSFVVLILYCKEKVITHINLFAFKIKKYSFQRFLLMIYVVTRLGILHEWRLSRR